MKIKKSMLVIVIIIITVGISYFILGGSDNKVLSKKEEKSNKVDYSKVKGILIYSNWTGDISAATQEEIRVQIPVYDFHNELGSYTVQVENFNIGEVKDYDLTLQNEFPAFKQYTLEFTLVPTKEGIQTIKDLKVRIDTQKATYEETLGQWVFNISGPLETKQPLKIEGGSIFSEWQDEKDTIEYRSKLYNASSSGIHLVGIENNVKEIMLSNKEINTDLDANGKSTYESKVNISGTSGNVYFKPRLLYRVNEKTYIFPLNLTIYASPVPTSELNDLLKKKHMIVGH